MNFIVTLTNKFVYGVGFGLGTGVGIALIRVSPIQNYIDRPHITSMNNFQKD